MRQTLLAILAALFVTACPAPKHDAVDAGPAHVGDPAPVARTTGQPKLHRTAEQIISAQLHATVLDWQHRVIQPDDVAAQLAGTYVVTFESGELAETDQPGKLAFSGHGFEGLDTKVLVSFTEHPPVIKGEMPGPFGGSVSLRYGSFEGTLDVSPDAAAALARESLVTQFLIRVLGTESSAEGERVIDCELLGVRVIAPSRGEILIEGEPAQPLR